jgi:type IV pilus assembly protein PilW
LPVNLSHCPSRLFGRRQAGVSLVEIMVALAVGMIITAAMLLLFANASSQGQNIQRASSHIENGRYATEYLREDLSLAGFFGELAAPGRHPDPALSYYVSPDPCDTTPGGFWTLATAYVFPTPVRGYAATDALGCLSNRRAGTDALAIRRVEVVNVAAASLAATNTQPHLQASFCRTDPATTPLVFDTAKASFTLNALDCVTRNVVRAYVSRVYFIASCLRCGTGGDSIPTLKRIDLVGAELVETPLVEGVESLRLEYGFDTNADGNADTYLTAPTVAGETSHWENVMALRLHLIVRSTAQASGSGLATAQTFDLGGAGTVTSAADGFVRHAYTSTVRLVNPSGARER